MLISLVLFLCNHSFAVGPLPHCPIALVSHGGQAGQPFQGYVEGAGGRAFYRVRGVDVWGGTLVGFSVLTVLAGPGATCHRYFCCHMLVTFMPFAAVGGGVVQLGACLPVGSLMFWLRGVLAYLPPGLIFVLRRIYCSDSPCTSNLFLSVFTVLFVMVLCVFYFVGGPMVFGVRDRKVPVIAVDVLPALI